MVGNLIVLAVVAIAVALAIRSLWKTHKNGGGCNGDCSQCGGCHCCENQIRTGGKLQEKQGEK
jgi:hypothetical protein